MAREELQEDDHQAASEYYVIVTNRHRGLYWVYKREARGRVAPEGRAFIKPIQTDGAG